MTDEKISAKFLALFTDGDNRKYGYHKRNADKLIKSVDRLLKLYEMPVDDPYATTDQVPLYWQNQKPKKVSLEMFMQELVMITSYRGKYLHDEPVHQLINIIYQILGRVEDEVKTQTKRAVLDMFHAMNELEMDLEKVRGQREELKRLLLEVSKGSQKEAKVSVIGQGIKKKADVVESKELVENDASNEDLFDDNLDDFGEEDDDD